MLRQLQKADSSLHAPLALGMTGALESQKPHPPAKDAGRMGHPLSEDLKQQIPRFTLRWRSE
jgi:hypothetical protein